MVRPHAIKNRLGLRMKKFDNVERKKRQKSVRSREEQENNGRLGEKKQGVILGLKKRVLNGSSSERPQRRLRSLMRAAPGRAHARAHLRPTASLAHAPRPQLKPAR